MRGARPPCTALHGAARLSVQLDKSRGRRHPRYGSARFCPTSAHPSAKRSACRKTDQFLTQGPPPPDAFPEGAYVCLGDLEDGQIATTALKEVVLSIRRQSQRPAN
jgi:hypothetical protein